MLSSGEVDYKNIRVKEEPAKAEATESVLEVRKYALEVVTKFYGLRDDVDVIGKAREIEKYLLEG